MKPFENVKDGRNEAMMPGPGGSLGACVYCGKNFLTDIIMGNSVKTVKLGGSDFPLHADGCFEALLSLGENGKLAVGKWKELPDESPLKPILKTYDEELTHEAL